MDTAQKRAWQHIKYNMDAYSHRIPEVFPGLVEHFRSLTRS